MTVEGWPERPARKAPRCRTTSSRTAARRAQKICGSRETYFSNDDHVGRALRDRRRRRSNASSRAEKQAVGISPGEEPRFRGPRGCWDLETTPTDYERAGPKDDLLQ